MKARFLTTLDVRYKDGKEWELLSPLVVVAKDKLIRVPPGFVTDFASIPRWIPFAMMFFGNTGHKSAVVHDYLYSIRHPRAEADAIFKALLEEEGAGWFRANAMYAGVRVGGGAYYDEEQ